VVFAVRREIVRGEVGVVQFSDKRAFVVVAANMESLDRQTLLESFAADQRTGGQPLLLRRGLLNGWSTESFVQMGSDLQARTPQPETQVVMRFVSYAHMAISTRFLAPSLPMRLARWVLTVLRLM
jgi:hypothetical protein